MECSSSASDVTVRFEGRQYHNDRKISPAQKAGFRNVLDAYEVVRFKKGV
jgi:hypothetical protein